jgi:hypothetical protein
VAFAFRYDDASSFHPLNLYTSFSYCTLLFDFFIHTEGNQLLRDIVRENVPRYMGAQSKHDKGAVIVEILERIQRDSPSGYGLVRQNQDTGRWHYIGTDKAKDKIGHALRKSAREYEKTNPKSVRSITTAAADGCGSNSRIIIKSNSNVSRRCGGAMVNLSSSGPVTLSSSSSARTTRDRSHLPMSSFSKMTTSEDIASAEPHPPPIPAQVTVPSSPVRSNSSTSLHSQDIDDGRKKHSIGPYYPPTTRSYGAYGGGSPSRYSPSYPHGSYDHRRAYHYNRAGPSPPPPPHPPASSSHHDPRHYQYHYYFHHQHHHHHYRLASRKHGGEGINKDGSYTKDADERHHEIGYVATHVPPTERSLTSVSLSHRYHNNNINNQETEKSSSPYAYNPDCGARIGSKDYYPVFESSRAVAAACDFDPIPVTSNDLSHCQQNNQNRGHAHHHHAAEDQHHQRQYTLAEEHHDNSDSPAKIQDLCGFGGASFHALEPENVANAADFEPVPYARSVSENESVS